MIRMCPVIMAAVVALVGLIPAALSTGIGAQSQRPFAIVIVCGLMPATFLTLTFLPAVYQWFVGKARKPVPVAQRQPQAALPPSNPKAG